MNLHISYSNTSTLSNSIETKTYKIRATTFIGSIRDTRMVLASIASFADFQKEFYNLIIWLTIALLTAMSVNIMGPPGNPNNIQ